MSLGSRSTALVPTVRDPAAAAGIKAGIGSDDGLVINETARTNDERQKIEYER